VEAERKDLGGTKMGISKVVRIRGKTQIFHWKITKEKKGQVGIGVEIKKVWGYSSPEKKKHLN